MGIFIRGMKRFEENGEQLEEEVEVEYEAPNGGSRPKQGIYSGNAVTIADGSGAQLTFDTASGDALLDLSTPDVPTFIESGTYAVTATIASTAPLTAGGYVTVTTSATPFGNLFDTSGHPDQGCTTTAICTVSAGDGVAVAVDNHDGAASRDFWVYNCVVVKLA